MIIKDFFHYFIIWLRAHSRWNFNNININIKSTYPLQVSKVTVHAAELTMRCGLGLHQFQIWNQIWNFHQTLHDAITYILWYFIQSQNHFFWRLLSLWLFVGPKIDSCLIRNRPFSKPKTGSLFEYRLKLIWAVQHRGTDTLVMIQSGWNWELNISSGPEDFLGWWGLIRFAWQFYDSQRRTS